jgi:hypothetical protein
MQFALPVASDFRPLRQTGTLLATGARFRGESVAISAREVAAQTQFWVPVSPASVDGALSVVGRFGTCTIIDLIYAGSLSDHYFGDLSD